MPCRTSAPAMPLSSGGRPRTPGARPMAPPSYRARRRLSWCRRRLRHVQRRPLVRVLAVAQGAVAGPHLGDEVRPAGLLGDLIRGVARSEPGGHRRVIGGRVRVGLGREAAALLQREAAAGDGLEHLVVLSDVGDDREAAVVLRRGTDHRGAADVDLLDDRVVVPAGSHGLLERVQRRHQELERLDAEVGELLVMVRVQRVREQARVDAGVQGLDPAVEALGEAC